MQLRKLRIPKPQDKLYRTSDHDGHNAAVTAAGVIAFGCSYSIHDVQEAVTLVVGAAQALIAPATFPLGFGDLKLRLEAIRLAVGPMAGDASDGTQTADAELTAL